MNDVVVLGVGMHPWGKFPEKSWVELGVISARKALKDAGVEWKDMNSLVCGVYSWGGKSGLYAGQQLAAALGETGLPIVNVYNACATATSVFRVGCMTVASGYCDFVICTGLDVSPKGFFPPLSDDPKKDPDVYRWKLMGMTNPTYWAMECRKRMERFGTTEEDLARVKAITSKNGSINPNARYRKEFSLEEVLNSPMVCDPLRLLEIAATSDGSASVVLCSSKKAKQYTTKPVTVAAATLGSAIYGDPTMRLSTISTTATRVAEAPLLSESYSASQQAYEQAGIDPKELDLVELPDNSSWHYLQYMETLGLCGPGEAERLVADGETCIDGKIPICPSGGVSSFGEALAAQGLAQICEIVWQLRGEAGVRTVKNAKVGLAQTYGMAGNSASAILKV
jgi:acetyl-CoA acetyltransferase